MTGEEGRKVLVERKSIISLSFKTKKRVEKDCANKSKDKEEVYVRCKTVIELSADGFIPCTRYGKTTVRG